jgi:hypothetical protein
MTKTHWDVIAPTRLYIAETSEDRTTINGAITEMLTLKDGWYFGSGIAPSLSAVTRAWEIATMLCSAQGTRIGSFPDQDGGIMINADVAGSYIQVTCHNAGKYDYLEENDSYEDEKEAITKEYLLEKLGSLRWEPKHTSDSCIRGTMMTRESVS